VRKLGIVLVATAAVLLAIDGCSTDPGLAAGRVKEYR
jgi:hypothetical protein